MSIEELIARIEAGEEFKHHLNSHPSGLLNRLKMIYQNKVLDLDPDVFYQAFPDTLKNEIPYYQEKYYRFGSMDEKYRPLLVFKSHFYWVFFLKIEGFIVFNQERIFQPEDFKTYQVTLRKNKLRRIHEH